MIHICQSTAKNVQNISPQSLKNPHEASEFCSASLILSQPGFCCMLRPIAANTWFWHQKSIAIIAIIIFISLCKHIFAYILSDIFLYCEEHSLTKKQKLLLWIWLLFLNIFYGEFTKTYDTRWNSICWCISCKKWGG